jgi:general stress protein YciG
MNTPPKVNATKLRGFGSMTAAQKHKIASAGGKQAHIDGTAHQFTSEEAREAGRKGGLARAAKYKAAKP